MAQAAQHQHRLTLEHAGPQSPTQAQLTSSNLQQLGGSDEYDSTQQSASPAMSTRTSFESDRFSAVSSLTNYFPNKPTRVNPAPAYIAPFGASQVVSEHLASKKQPSSDDEDDEKLNKDEVEFTEPALALVNAFLDQLLYSFLSTARSTNLLALRPAVTEVLRHRLAKDAIASAEEELADLIGGGEDEEDESKQSSAENNRRWDLELVWKRTRLRVMVYTRLGELEDEDEQRYVQEEELFHGNERTFSESGGLVSWAAAIFLTSVLEYVAEQTLQVAGQAAYTRARRQSRTRRLAFPSEVRMQETLVVEEYDVEKVALNSTLGRLWRTWRKALRNNTGPSTPKGRSPSNTLTGRDRMMAAMSHHRGESATTLEDSVADDSRPMSRQREDPSEIEYPEHILAANIPLPLGDSTRDVDEIVVPGLAKDPDDEDGDRNLDAPYSEELLGTLVSLPIDDEKRDVDEIEVPGLARDPDTDEDHDSGNNQQNAEPVRRYSFSGPLSYPAAGGLPTPEDSKPGSPTQTDMPKTTRQRSMSVPTPPRTPMSRVRQADASTVEEQKDEHTEDAEDVEEGTNDSAAQSSATADSQQVDETVNAPEEQVAEEEQKSEFPWMAGGAAAGVASTIAAATTAAAATGTDAAAGTSNDDTTHQRGVGGLADGPSDSGDRLGETTDHSGPTEQSRPERDTEELDKRKSLIDIKAIMAVNSPSGPGSARESPKAEPQVPSYMRAGALRNNSKSVNEDAVMDVSKEAIGIAQTADVPSTLVQGGQARDYTTKPTGVILGNEWTSQSPDSPTIKQTASPRAVQRPFVVTDLDQQPQPGQNQSPEKPSPKTDLSNGTHQSPQRQLASAFEKQSSTASRSRSESQVQEHPAIQRMASAKRYEPKSPKSPRTPILVSDSDKVASLTSASIKGPEDFEAFMQGDGTVKYTLTPQTVRDDPTTVRQLPVEMDATSQTADAASRAGRTQSARQASIDDDDTDSRRRSFSRPSPKNTNSHKSGLMAREPRVATQSTRDFADFIRSTGPKKEATITPIMPNASSTSLHSLRSAHIQGAAASRSSSPTGDRSRSNTQNGGNDKVVPPVPPVPVKQRSTMQPRGATASSGGSAELIDFIRSGPEEDGKHRISRSVAPFRTTMDSDQLTDLADGLGTDRTSDMRLNPNFNGASSLQTASSVRSVSERTSANSRSALLNGPSAVPRNIVAQENEPIRKRVRTKDPYAMDFLNEDEDDDLLSSLPKTTRREESLVDFLSNNEPPKDNAPRPVIDPNSAQAQNAIMRARANNQRSSNSLEIRTPSIMNRGRPQSGYGNFGYSVPRSRQSNTDSSATTAKPRMQARGGAKDIAANSNTKELAEFFKTATPEDPNSAPAPSIGRAFVKGSPAKEEAKPRKKPETSKFGAFFSRTRKKTYLDMP